MKEIQKVVQKLSRGQESAAAAAAYEPVQKHIKSPPVYRGDLTRINTLIEVVPMSTKEILMEILWDKT